jgi:hypothetical protein
MTDIEKVENEATATEEPKACETKPWYQGYNSRWANLSNFSVLSTLSNFSIFGFMTFACILSCTSFMSILSTERVVLVWTCTFFVWIPSFYSQLACCFSSTKSQNSFMSIMSINSFMAIGCSNESFKNCYLED